MPFSSPSLFNRKKASKPDETIEKTVTETPPKAPIITSPSSPSKVDAYLSPTSTSVPSYPAPTPPSTTGSIEFRKEALRIEKLLEGLSNNENAPTWLKGAVEKLGPLVIQIMILAKKSTPYIILMYEKWQWCESNLPVELLVIFWGLTLCFFGGTFSLSLCAYEAFKISGWDTSRAAIIDLNEELQRYRRASVEDDKRDDDGDGIADVDQIGQGELVKRKVMLALKVSDPNKVNDAIGGITQGVVGVVATLKFKHARTVALGVSIGNYLRRPAGMYLAPHIATLVPPAHRKWVPHVINYACKVVAVSIAWTVSSVVSAVQCGVRGGLMAARAGLKYLKKRKIVDIDDEDTYLDEVVGWSLAFVGAGFQIWNGFGLPFPLNVIMLPARLLEGYLRWIVTN
mmetsp:Transcript_16228/g.33343  ORF Transcript_16228/g.33343 Transcript_16228/m.33343 type:complete len:399 (+) Transcript_16228:44-1240(+)